MRSKEEINKLISLYNQAISGDVDALIKVSEIIFADELNGGNNHGSNIKRKNIKSK